MQALIRQAAADLRALRIGAAGPAPGDAERAARWLWHDTLACAASGYRADAVRALLAQHEVVAPGRFRPPAAAAAGATRTGAGGGSGVGATAGALLNAVAACWDEACEGSALAHGRPGVPVVAALWALAAHRPLRWARVLEATVIGYQVGASMGAYLRIRPGMHVDAVWPGLGVAVACAHALGLSEEGLLDAAETCAIQLPASLYLPIAQGCVARNTYLGHSAWLGLTAALWAAAGQRGPRGAVREYAQRVLQRAADDGPAVHRRCLIEDAYWKPYACVRHVQYGARAAWRLRERLRAAAPGVPAAEASDGIDALRLVVYPEAQTYCGNRAPRSAIAAQFSLTHGVAAMLVEGDLAPAQFTPRCLGDRRVMRLEALVQVESDDERFGPHGRGAVLAVRHRGQWLEETVATLEGDADHPPSDEQRWRKFGQYCDGDAALIAAGRRILDADGATDAQQILETGR